MARRNSSKKSLGRSSSRNKFSHMRQDSRGNLIRVSSKESLGRSGSKSNLSRFSQNKIEPSSPVTAKSRWSKLKIRFAAARAFKKVNATEGSKKDGANKARTFVLWNLITFLNIAKKQSWLRTDVEVKFLHEAAKLFRGVGDIARHLCRSLRCIPISKSCESVNFTTNTSDKFRHISGGVILFCQGNILRNQEIVLFAGNASLYFSEEYETALRVPPWEVASGIQNAHSDDPATRRGYGVKTEDIFPGGCITAPTLYRPGSATSAFSVYVSYDSILVYIDKSDQNSNEANEQHDLFAVDAKSQLSQHIIKKTPGKRTVSEIKVMASMTSALTPFQAHDPRVHSVLCRTLEHIAVPQGNLIELNASDASIASIFIIVSGRVGVYVKSEDAERAVESAKESMAKGTLDVLEAAAPFYMGRRSSHAVAKVGYCAGSILLCELTEGMCAGEFVYSNIAVPPTSQLQFNARTQVQILRCSRKAHVQALDVVHGKSIPMPPESMSAAKLPCPRPLGSLKHLEEYIRNVHFFKQLPKNARLSLCAVASCEHYTAGHAIVREGDKGDRFYVIISGTCSVMASATRERSGQRTSAMSRRFGKCVAVLRAGSYFGEASLIEKQPRNASVVATEATTCLTLSLRQYQKVMDLTPQVTLTCSPKRMEAIEKDPEDRSEADISTLLDWVKAVKFFRKFNQVLTKKLVTEMYFDEMEKGSCVFHQGDAAENMYIIISGSVSVHQCSDEDATQKAKARAFRRRKTISMLSKAKQKNEGQGLAAAAADPTLEYGECVATLGSGTSFGELGVSLSGSLGLRNASCVCREDCNFFVVDKEVFQLYVVASGEGIATDVIRNIVAKLPVSRTRIEREVLLNLLGKLAFFKQLPIPIRQGLCDRITFRAFEESDLIVRQGDAGDAFYFILSGRIRVHIKHGERNNVADSNNAGKEVSSKRKGSIKLISIEEQQNAIFGDSVATLSAGDSFGEVALTRGTARTATCIAAENAELLCLSARDYKITLGQMLATELQFKPKLSHEMAMSIKDSSSVSSEERMKRMHNIVSPLRMFRDVAALQSSAKFNELLSELQYDCWDPASIVLSKGAAAGRVYIIVEGKVGLMFDLNDHGHKHRSDHSLTYLGPGKMFGELPVFFSCSQIFHARASELTKTVSLSQDAYDKYWPGQLKCSQIVQTMRSCWLFQNMSMRELAAFYHKARLKTVQRNTVLALERKHAKTLFLILDGTCRLVRNHCDGHPTKRAELGIVSRGYLFGGEHLASAEKATWKETLVAESQVTVWHWALTYAYDLFHNHVRAEVRHDGAKVAKQIRSHIEIRCGVSCMEISPASNSISDEQKSRKKVTKPSSASFNNANACMMGLMRATKPEQCMSKRVPKAYSPFPARQAKRAILSSPFDPDDKCRAVKPTEAHQWKRSTPLRMRLKMQQKHEKRLRRRRKKWKSPC